MIYLIGGAPRTGKSVISQQVSAKLRIGWISTDLLYEVLRVKQVEGAKTSWDASTEAIKASADWFYPCLERFVRGVSSMADHYLVEGVDFLPSHAAKLCAQHPVRALFLGCSSLSLADFNKYPGHSPGYQYLPEEMKRQIVSDIPKWSEFIQRECNTFGFPYLDMSTDFKECLRGAVAHFTA